MSPEIAKALGAVVAALAAVLASLQGVPSSGDTTTPTATVGAPPTSCAPGTVPSETTTRPTESGTTSEPATSPTESPSEPAEEGTESTSEKPTNDDTNGQDDGGEGGADDSKAKDDGKSEDSDTEPEASAPTTTATTGPASTPGTTEAPSTTTSPAQSPGPTTSADCPAPVPATPTTPVPTTEPVTAAPTAAAPQPAQNAPTNGAGRIALSSDGNQHDDDDWAASAMALALLAKGNLQRNVVNYIYNNHIWDSNAEHRKHMTESVMQGGQRFGFDTSAFFDGADAAKLQAGVKDLTADINASRPGDELTIVLAGPMETTWMALNAANPEARKNVKCVSHGSGTFNQTHGKKDHGGHSYDDVIALGCQRVQIPDQNSKLGPTKVSDWAYLSDLGPDMAWLYSRFQPAKQSKGDVSDAGMVYFVMTGKEAPTRADLKAQLQK